MIIRRLGKGNFIRGRVFICLTEMTLVDLMYFSFSTHSPYAAFGTVRFSARARKLNENLSLESVANLQRIDWVFTATRMLGQPFFPKGFRLVEETAERLPSFVMGRLQEYLKNNIGSQRATNLKAAIETGQLIALEELSDVFQEVLTYFAIQRNLFTPKTPLPKVLAKVEAYLKDDANTPWDLPNTMKWIKDDILERSIPFERFLKPFLSDLQQDCSQRSADLRAMVLLKLATLNYLADLEGKKRPFTDLGSSLNHPLRAEFAELFQHARDVQNQLLERGEAIVHTLPVKFVNRKALDGAFRYKHSQRCAQAVYTDYTDMLDRLKSRRHIPEHISFETLFMFSDFKQWIRQALSLRQLAVHRKRDRLSYDVRKQVTKPWEALVAVVLLEDDQGLVKPLHS